jgi:dual specificity MAP kinase phosphatase
MKNKREREEACYVCNHYHDYEGGEPCGICGHRLLETTEKLPPSSALPTEILPGFLYQGSYDHASRSELLKTVGITHILNTVPKCQVLYKNSFKYHTTQESPPPFEECFAFLESVRQEGARVLVHCMSGASRSPSVVIGYLMRLRSWRLTESYKWVKDRRPGIKLAEDEVVRLEELERSLRGSTSDDFRAALEAPSAPALSGGPFTWGASNAFSSPSWQPSPPTSTPPAAFNFVGRGGPGGKTFVFGGAMSGMPTQMDT